jgi:hypothetical protein
MVGVKVKLGARVRVAVGVAPKGRNGVGVLVDLGATVAYREVDCPPNDCVKSGTIFTKTHPDNTSRIKKTTMRKICLIFKNLPHTR